MTDNEREEEKSSPFKVDDRRKFSSEGELLSKTGTESKSEPEPRQGPSEPTQERKTERQKEPAIDFASFIMSLAASGMAYLGEMPDPATGERMENLDGAQQMIDILTLLQTKTKGNLETDEEQLLEHLLYELRMKYLTKRNVIRL